MIKATSKRPRIKNILSKAFLVCLVFTAFSQAGIVKNHGRLKVKGTRIVDSLGNPIQIAGMSLFWPEWGGSTFYTADAIKTLTNNWGCSLVRAPLPVYTPNSTPQYQYDAKWIQSVKTVIQAAIDNDIYVIADWHLEGDQPSPDLAKSFFTDIANTYGKYPNVIFELWNEPTNASWSTIKSYSEDLLKVIRPKSSNLVIVGSGEWSKRLGDPANSPVNDAASNIAYTFHFYACDHKQPFRDTVTKYASKIPLFFTEWGTTLASGTGSYCADESDKWMALAKNLGISWANWSFSNKGGVSAALTGTSLDGLTQSGSYVKGKIQEVRALITSVQKKKTANRVEAVKVNTRTMSLDIAENVNELSIMDSRGRVLTHQTIGSQKNIRIPDHAKGLVFIKYHSSDAVQVVPVMLCK